MIKVSILGAVFSMLLTLFSEARRCDLYSDVSMLPTYTSAALDGDAILIRTKTFGPLNGDNGEPGGHCFMGQLTYEQLQNLQDERLKAAIIRSLNSNSSWQQR